MTQAELDCVKGTPERDDRVELGIFGFACLALVCLYYIYIYIYGILTGGNVPSWLVLIVPNNQPNGDCLSLVFEFILQV